MRKERHEGAKRDEWDFSRFEEWMNRSFSFLKEDLAAAPFAAFPFPVGKVVQDALDRAFRGAFVLRKPVRSNVSRSEVFETHRSLIVRVFLPAGVRQDRVRTLVGTHRLRIEWPPDGRCEVPLSRPVNPRKSRAAIKNGVLEVRMPKAEERFYEL